MVSDLAWNAPFNDALFNKNGSLIFQKPDLRCLSGIEARARMKRLSYYRKEVTIRSSIYIIQSETGQ